MIIGTLGRRALWKLLLKCIDLLELDLDWGGFPDRCIILVHCNFAKKQEQELQGLVRFFKEYAPRYGYKYIGIEEIIHDLIKC